MTDRGTRQVVLDALVELSRAVSGKATDEVIALFESDAMLIGTRGQYVGVHEITPFVRGEVEQPGTMSWEWDEQSLVVASAEEIIWFIVTGEAVLTPATTSSSPSSLGMRLSGILRQQADGRWRWAQFHGSTADTD